VDTSASNSATRERRRSWVRAQKTAQRGPVSLRRRIFGALWSLIPAGLMGIWLFALIVRLTAQDRIEGTLMIVYYGTPPAVLGGIALVAGAWWLIPRLWIAAVPTLLIAVACFGWAATDTIFVSRPPPATGPTVRIMYWNVARGIGGWPRIAAEVAAHQPDVVGIAEFAENPSAPPPDLAERLPGYTLVSQVPDVALFSRVAVTGRFDRSQWSRLRYTGGTVEVDGRPLVLAVADVAAPLYDTRRRQTQRLCTLFDEHADAALVVIGDLNLPLDSVQLEPLRERSYNAFEIAGNGYSPTWPVPVPVLALDQAWVTSSVVVHDCRVGWTWISDHRPLILDVSVQPPAGTAE
jgi:vancomycin resistance protein VanJ